jgi:MIP family channel proteins
MKGIGKAALAELIGTFTLVFIGAGAGAMASQGAGLVGVALAHGIALTVIIYTWGKVSGAHVNPAVTLGVLFGGGISPFKAVVYWIVQLAGGAAAGFLLAYLLGATTGNLGQTIGSLTAVDPIKTMVLEGVLTFFLVAAVMSCGIANNFGNMVGLGIGPVLAMDILFGGPLTGASMNPARTFGPAVAAHTLAGFDWSYMWMYFVGPAIGGLVAGLLYRMFMPAKAVAGEPKESVRTTRGARAA